MATAKSYPPVIPFCAVMYREKELFEKALTFLKTKLNEPLIISDEINFSHETYYYDAEMGGKIKKVYIVFKTPMNREYLAELKLETNDFEMTLAKNGDKRQVNLDPGYITKDKFVLASAKDFSHRIAIGHGIFAETTLSFAAGNKIKRFSWTYNDYLLPPVQEILLTGRNAVGH